MTTLESELLAVVYAIYASDCVYWLRPEDTAFTRVSVSTWKRHRFESLRFSLLGRYPLFVDPLLLLPGFIRTSAVTSQSEPAAKRALTSVSRALNRHWVFEMQCRIQAMLLLLFLPWSIWTGRLPILWRSMAFFLALSHILLMLSFFLVLRRNRITKPLSVAAPLLLNPLGSTRVLDLLSQTLFNQRLNELKERSVKSAR